MSVTWTEQQEQVIKLHNRNLLVAAAAGSGKTAVLVERIIQMITRKENPVDIDRLLVVTFTNAAAAEMRERIGKALEAALKEDPGNLHLQSQVTLLHNAQISTIHSFGLHVIRNHFYQIDLDPGFRIGDEREIRMLKEDVMEEVLKAAYEDAAPAFLDFVKAYGNSKNDKNICEMILEFYNYADSYPWPKEWLHSCMDVYQCETLEEFEAKDWVGELGTYVSSLVANLKERICYAKKLAAMPDGPQLYLPTLESDLAVLEQLDDCQTYGQWYQTLKDLSFARLPGKKQVCDETIKTLVKAIRDEVKDQITDIRKHYFSYSATEQFGMLQDIKPMMQVLIDLTEDFMHRFAKAKESKNIIDFGDIEHFTLKILIDENTKELTATAREYQEQFVEVMIDEYQDSNYVQEALLQAVSKQSKGINNMFMVGDVKQSIYRFRLARPELFMEKYRGYAVTDAPGESQRIDLHKNFRSRPEVLDFTNEVFFHVMDDDIGNVLYDEDAALYVGREIEETQIPGTYKTELLLMNPETSIEDKVAYEAKVVATKIRQMTDPVTAGEFCPEYKDIVILVHAMKGWSDVFQKVFAEEGIPLISASRSGYFATNEVQTLIQLLKVLSNPRQDIALAGVLRCVIGDFRDRELAQLKAAFPELGFYESVIRWRDLSGEDAARIVSEKIADSEQLIAIHEKIIRFFEWMEQTRGTIPDTPIHELLQNIYRQTGYLDYVTALPGGERRRANLDMLVELAISYENSSYQGLFDFVRYIEKMIRYELDYGEAELVSEQENAVRMMTIHKSKGLEFPVVFLCGMGKDFNMTSLNNPLIFHPQYGAGLRWMSKEHRIRRNALARQIFGLLEKRELLGEEQRLLYVALTRAKEKLILTGIAKQTERYEGLPLGTKEVLPFSQRMDAKCFWDWVLPAVFRGNIDCHLQLVDDAYILAGQTLQHISRAKQKEKLLEAVSQVDELAVKQMDEALGWTYPHEGATAQKQKVSVSELKHRFMEQQDLEDEAVFLHKEQEVMPYIPRFADRVEEENAGALRGTAMHRYLECFDFGKLEEVYRCILGKQAHETSDNHQMLQAFMHSQLEEMSQSGKLSKDLRNRLNMKQIETFLSSEAAKSMAQAAVRGDLYREKPFMMSVPASEVWEGASKEEPVLVQGIVDVFWMEEDGITLLDYKTDAVSHPEELVKRYQLQLQLYGEALSRVFDNCKVKDILIYSFKFNDVISLLDRKKELE